MPVSKSPAHYGRSEREPRDLFRTLPGDLAPRRMASSALLRTRFNQPKAYDSRFEIQGAAA